MFSRDKVSSFGLIFGLFTLSLFLFSDHPEGLSRIGWLTAGIALLMTIWWVTEAIPIYVTGLIPLILFPLFNIFNLKIIASSYSHPLVLLFLGGFSHLRCMFTNPGAVPKDAMPLPQDVDKARMHGKTPRKCQRSGIYKPPRAHFDSGVQRNVIKMDHHCPWVNNTVGLGNHKFFMLFLFSLIICLLLFFLSETILNLFGEDFASGNTILIIIIPSIFIRMISIPCNAFLSGTKYIYIIAAAALLSGVFTPLTIDAEAEQVVFGMLVIFLGLAGGIIIFLGIKKQKFTIIMVCGGLGLMVASLILIYEVANRSLFG